MSDEEAVKAHLDLSLYHAQKANEAVLSAIHGHHVDMSQRLALEAKSIVFWIEANKEPPAP
jgi:hypothetical protein